MELNVLYLYGWLLIGISFTAVIHMLGASVLFIKAFQCEKGLLIYGGIVSILAAGALASGIAAQIHIGFILTTMLLTLLSFSQIVVLQMSQQTVQYRKIWLSSNSSIVALLAFILAKQLSLLVV